MSFLAEGTRTGKLATVRSNGRPHVVPIWFVVDVEGLAFTTWHTSVKAKNLAHAPRAALTVDLEEPPYAFVTVEGPVDISDDLSEVREIAVRTGARYMGADQGDAFGDRNAVEGELAVRLRFEHLISAADMAE